LSHFVTFVLVPTIEDGDRSDYESATEKLLAPYDEEREVKPYRELFADQEWNINKMREHYEVQDESLEALLPHMKDWCGNEGYVEDGKLGIITTYNPDSKWDWWVVGGRWSDYFNGKSILPMSELPTDWHESGQTPYAVVTRNGEWHQKAEMHWFGVSTNEQEPEAWRNECSEIFSGHQDCMIVVCDLHI